MRLIKSSFIVVISVWLLACSQQDVSVQTDFQNDKQQSNEKNPSKDQQTPSPVITPTPELEVSFGKGLRIVPKTVNLENQTRRYKIDIGYPQVEGSTNPGIMKLNRRIKDLAANEYAWPLIPPTKGDLLRYEKWPGVFNSVLLDYEVVLATDGFLSIYFQTFSYAIGAAHSVQHSFTVNYDFNSGRLLRLSDVFNPSSKYLQFVSDYCIEELTKRNGEYINKEELAPKVKNFESWNLTKEGVRLNFNACLIAGCAAGEQRVEIPFVSLQQWLDPKRAG